MAGSKKMTGTSREQDMLVDRTASSGYGCDVVMSHNVHEHEIGDNLSRASDKTEWGKHPLEDRMSTCVGRGPDSSLSNMAWRIEESGNEQRETHRIPDNKLSSVWHQGLEAIKPDTTLQECVGQSAVHEIRANIARKSNVSKRDWVSPNHGLLAASAV